MKPAAFLIALLLGLLSTVALARGMSMVLPVYVHPGDPYLKNLRDPAKTPTLPPYIVLNVADGDGDQSVLDADADALRARTASDGKKVRVLGYVYTSYAKRSDSSIKASVDRYLGVRNGKVHFDGIMFDEVTRECGPRAGSMQWRDKYRGLRQYVVNKVPGATVIDNVGTAVFDCYLTAGKDTADIFVTFEDTAEHYLINAESANWAYGWVGGNIVQNDTYVLGTQYGSNRFTHLVYNTSRADWQKILRTALDRYAGFAFATDDYFTSGALGPWDLQPTFLNDEIKYMGTLKAN